MAFDLRKRCSLAFLALWAATAVASAMVATTTPTTTTSASTTTSLAAVVPPGSPCSAEVVGATGRMGTFWLQRHFSLSPSLPGPAVACPKGSVPGTRTPPGAPIYVATPSGAYGEIYEATPFSRRRDLVFAGNPGLPIDDRFGEATVLVPHFSVLYENQWANSKSESDGESESDYSARSAIRVDTDPERSPPTYVYGRHAETVAGVLKASGILPEPCGSFGSLKAHSGRKLLWASCLWLLCHEARGNGNGNARPLTVGEVHATKKDDLEKLVDELLPSLGELLLSGTNDDADRAGVAGILDRGATLAYLRNYSESIPGAVPSVDLAREEFADRNGVWLRRRGGGWGRNEQPYHRELLEKQGLGAGGFAPGA